MKRRSSFQRSRVPDKLARVVVGLLFVCFGVADIAFADGTGSLEKLHRSAAERSEPYHGFRIHRRMRDGNNHAIFAVRQWSRRTFPGISQRSRGDKVIEREEQHIQRLQIDALSERKQSLATDLAAKQEKVNELQQGKVIPLTSLYVVRIWHRDPDTLAARAASLKNAFISTSGSSGWCRICPRILTIN
jgi:hypothetical protein